MLETREGGCHCGRVRFRATVDLDQLSHCSGSICTKKGIFHLPVFPQDFTLLSGKDDLTVYTFETGNAQHPFCKHCGIAVFANVTTNAVSHPHKFTPWTPDGRASLAAGYR